MRRGEVWWASLPEPQASGPGYRSPVVVIQNNSFNESRIRTVIVAVITSNQRLASAPGNIVLNTRESQLSRDSVINVSQILAVDKTFLTELVSTLSEHIMTELDDGIRLVLDL